MFDYDSFYSKQGADFLNHAERHSLVSFLCRGRVADFGCCMGILSDYFFGDYTGFDISKIALDKGREIRRKNIKLIHHDCSDLSSIDIENYDTFVMTEFLEHFENDDKILGPIFSRAKSGSRIIVSVPNGPRIPDPSHLRVMTIPELRKKFSPYGKIKFYNWPGAKLQILMTCDIGQKNADLISLVIPAKNEEKGLENAILSCIEFVDNVVVSVDSASVDKTLEVAQLYADTLKVYNWENSFSKARNFAQEGVNTKWVLALDGHEFVAFFSNLDQALALDKDSLEIKIILENGFSFHFPRIVRSYVKWEADVHNFPVVKTRGLFSEFLIRHDRENLQARESIEIRNKQRSEMVRKVMNGEIDRNPDNPRPYFYLAQQFFIERCFKEAIKMYKKYLKHSTHKGERWLVHYETAHARAFLGQYLRALWTLRDADEEIPGRWEVEKARGAIFAMAGKYERAITHLVESFNENTGTFTYYPEKRNDAQTWDFIANCLYILKKIPEAKVAWKRFLELEEKKPENERNNNQIEIIKRMLEI